MPSKEACIFDVDGVLVYPEERIRRAKELASSQHKDYRISLDRKELIQFDRPRPVGIKLLKRKSKECAIIIITGRLKEYYELTLEEIVNLTGVKPELIIMREKREKNILRAKLAMIRKVINKGYIVKEIHDDDANFLREVRIEYPQIRLFRHIHDRYIAMN